MANWKKIQDESLATVDSALSILNKFPSLEEGGLSVSLNESMNPFPYLLELFKHTQGYDILVKVLSSFITTALPAVELSVKTMLFTNIKNLITCAVNPIISDKMLREGIVFNLSEIDLTDMLRYSPTSEFGKYYYFGCDGPANNYVVDEQGNQVLDDNGNPIKKVLSDEEIRDTAYNNDWNNDGDDFSLASKIWGTRDMNALLWYMRHKSVMREVWGVKKGITRGQALGLEDLPTDLNSKGKPKYPKSKDLGIVTIEYNANAQSLRDAEGNNMTTQIPGYDMIHVFIGNAARRTDQKAKEFDEGMSNNRRLIRDLTDVKNVLEANINSCDYSIKRYKSNTDITDDQREEYINFDTACKTRMEYLLYNDNDPGNNEETINKNINQWITNLKTCVYYIKERDETNANFLKDELATKNVYSVNTLINICSNKLSHFASLLAEISDGSNIYAPIKDNYYRRRTLIEFNYDYIMSLKLFDEKVVTVQLLDALVGLTSINLGLSYNQIMIREEIKKMVQQIVETDDAVVDDCFFTFSNETFDRMQQKTNLRKAGLFTVNGETNATNSIDPQAILDSLNGINEDATPEEVSSIIEGALLNISGTITSYNNQDTDQFSINKPNINFIDNLMDNLAYVISSALLSPKVYLLFLINLKTLGEDANFDLKGFIDHFKQLITDLLRTVRDELIKYLMNYIMKYLGELAQLISVKIIAEQGEYYARLIKKCINCIKLFKGKGLDFTIDDAVVDIYEQENNQPINSTC